MAWWDIKHYPILFFISSPSKSSSDAYPYKSPSIGFLNKIFHPNFDDLSRSVGLNVINQSWSPMLDLLNVFEDFLPELLLYPNPSDPLNGDATSLMMKDKMQYDQEVKGFGFSISEFDDLLGHLLDILPSVVPNP